MSPLSQRDPQWKNELLGFSTLTIGDDGCALTAYTMLVNGVLGLSLTPSMMNADLKANGAFQGAKIIWNKIPYLQFVSRDLNYNNLKVAWYIYGKNIPVMVEVHPPSTVSSWRHWVLYVGRHLCIDPWDGTLKPTSTYPAVGAAFYLAK